MSGKKWFGVLLAALVLVFVAWAGLNILVDPFGTYGDMLFGWDAYSQTLNPRNAKAVYISQHFDEYDSYIIGSSSAASYSPEELDGYLDASFYNMFHYGADTKYDRDLVSYLLERDNDVKYIFLVLGLNEANTLGVDDGTLTERGFYEVTGESALSYYVRFLFASPSYAFEKLSSYRQDTEMPQVFDVFLPESGCYDKRIRDVESIGALEPYLEKNGASFPQELSGKELPYIDECAENVAAIRSMCEEAGAELIVVLSPVCEEQRNAYSSDTLNSYYAKLAQVTDYWNFSITPLTYDERFFYDATHTRNAVGSMVLAQIFDNDCLYRPEFFGIFCEAGDPATVEELEAGAGTVPMDAYTATVPILLYHHLVEAGEESGTVLRAETFAHQMDLLEENGYHPVSFSDLIAFVEQGEPLPDKPVVLTFDDGYYSNYEYAYPILLEHQFPATIFTIGCSIGHEKYYKNTEYMLTPHFGANEISEMIASGLISIHSHTYDMHQWAPFEDSPTPRTSILPLEGESEEAYIAALVEDVEQQNAVFALCGMDPSNVLAFPSGKFTTLTDVILRSLGYQVTVTTDNVRVNTLVKGLPQTLVDLGRLAVSGDTTDKDILSYLSQ